ncbi:MAG: DUF5706 domain-containing protein [Chitinophagaceae bacterium]|nr:DUF5706 domain-containing protein [Chitinophagaceae bacterium]
MSKAEKSLVKKALEFFYQFAENHSEIFLFHDFRFVNETVIICKEIAKAEDLSKAEYEPGLVALILCDLGWDGAQNLLLNNEDLVNTFFDENGLEEEERKTIRYYINFLKTNKSPLNKIERVIRDGKDIHLGLPDALERLSLLQLEEQKRNNKTYTQIEWLEQCKQYFITHAFDTHYAYHEYGATRSKNYIELEKRLEKLRLELLKEKRNSERLNGVHLATSKENEDLFKIAFRNYVNLIDIADKKAGLLIQVNSILASVVVALVLKKLEDNNWFALPTAGLLVGSAVTIFYSIMASKPLENWEVKNLVSTKKEEFFFGSFDRLDPNFKHVDWQKYLSDMTEFFNGDKNAIFVELIKESYEVRQVLSRKFNYLSIAYKVFFAGLLLSIIGFIIVILHDMGETEETKKSPFGALQKITNPSQSFSAFTYIHPNKKPA